MRWGSLLIAMMVAGGAHAALDCRAEDGVRQQAECVHDAMTPEVIGKLYGLALSTVRGELDPRNVPADFLYIAEEAGEAARRKSPKPLVEMARTNDVSQLAFAARAITAFLAAVQDGHSHRNRFDNKGDVKLSADAKTSLRVPCKRLAEHEVGFLRAEGRRCLAEIERAALPALFGGTDVDFTGVGEAPSGGGALRGVDTVGLPVPEAAPSYRERCDKGDGKACHLLAELNRFERFGPGRTYPKNIVRAVDLYRRGCDLGFAASCSDLAAMLRAGKEVPRDAARAAAVDRRACKLNRKACPK